MPMSMPVSLEWFLSAEDRLKVELIFEHGVSKDEGFCLLELPKK
jgi:hypothetical protein